MNLSKRIQPLYVLIVVCCLLAVSNVLVWRSKAGFQKNGISLAEHIRKLESNRQAAALQEKTLQDQKKELELHLMELSKEAANASSQLESEKAAHQQFAESTSAKENEIVRLNDEVARLNAEVEKYRQENAEASGNLANVNAAYEELKQKLLDLSERKKIPDEDAQKFLKGLAEEDQPASLGTSIIKG